MVKIQKIKLGLPKFADIIREVSGINPVQIMKRANTSYSATYHTLNELKKRGIVDYIWKNKREKTVHLTEKGVRLKSSIRLVEILLENSEEDRCECGKKAYVNGLCVKCFFERQIDVSKKESELKRGITI